MARGPGTAAPSQMWVQTATRLGFWPLRYSSGLPHSAPDPTVVASTPASSTLTSSARGLLPVFSGLGTQSTGRQDFLLEKKGAGSAVLTGVSVTGWDAPWWMNEHVRSLVVAFLSSLLGPQPYSGIWMEHVARYTSAR